ncbi:MAG: FAD-dependent oxidoreductase [Bacteroidota bacterium]|nr:FAD-dependent oxidoreductase [Bacteroidota bacterium]
MAKPIIYIVHEDLSELQEIEGAMDVYKDNFHIKTAINPENLIQELQQKPDEEIALFLVEDDLKSMKGLHFFKEIKENFPDAKKVLLTQVRKKNETNNAFKEDNLDCYIIKPYKPVEEKLYPVLDDMLLKWKGSGDESEEEIKVVGPRWFPPVHKIMNFLSRNLFPYTFHDIEKDPSGWQLLKDNNIKTPTQVLVLFSDGTAMVNPEISDIASKAGLNLNPESQFYDLIIIGAGPAGLAASVYASSEGLSTLVIEKEAPGGQAGTSAHIANYLGFPGGISGEELSKRAIAQAEKFGVEILRASEVNDIKINKSYKSVILNNQILISSYCVLISTGVSYKTLKTQGFEKFNGAGIYYGAVNTEAPLCEGQDVFIIGGGNSAGQAAMYLSHFAKNVRILIIEESLETTMSHYLIEQIESTPNIEVHTTTEVKEAFGNKQLEKVRIHNNSTGETKEFTTSAIFIYIGAEPQTNWLPKEILRDEKGFIITGFDLIKNGEKPDSWKLNRFPGLLETSIPGIYAAGDIRFGSVKRVASAVGEGAMAVTMIHQYLNQ